MANKWLLGNMREENIALVGWLARATVKLPWENKKLNEIKDDTGPYVLLSAIIACRMPIGFLFMIDKSIIALVVA